eukprot:scaffold271_cov252-Pinguiococcus_pyrenoidosus.AAC.12
MQKRSRLQCHTSRRCILLRASHILDPKSRGSGRERSGRRVDSDLISAGKNVFGSPRDASKRSEGEKVRERYSPCESVRRCSFCSVFARVYKRPAHHKSWCPQASVQALLIQAATVPFPLSVLESAEGPLVLRR